MSDVQIIKDASGVPVYVAVVTGCLWSGHDWDVYDMDSNSVARGHSIGDSAMAMRNAKRAARRLMKAGKGGE